MNTLKRIFCGISLGTMLMFLAACQNEADSDPQWNSALKVEDNAGNVHLFSNLDQADLMRHFRSVYQDKDVQYYRLEMDRGATFSLNIFQFEPDFGKKRVIYSTELKMKTIGDVMQENPDLIFGINSSYFDQDDRPLGWVRSENYDYSSELSRFSGYILVTKDDFAFVGSRDLRRRMEGRIFSAIQTYPTLIENHDVVIERESIKKERMSQDERTWRVMAGMSDEGKICFIASDTGALLNRTDMADIARVMDLRNAVLLDGGGSVQYVFRYGRIFKEFSVRRRRVPVFFTVESKS